MPEAVPGTTFDDVVTARVAYDRLDREGAAGRIRLRSTVVRVAHVGDPAGAREVEVTYVQDGQVRTVRGARCVLACWNAVIPHLCPELPAAQREALAYGIKAPIVYTNALLRNWTAFERLKVASVTAPGSYHTTFFLAEPVGGGQLSRLALARGADRRPDGAHPLPAGPLEEGPASGRARRPAVHALRHLRAEGEGPARPRAAGRPASIPSRDLLALTVNRWPHGYAYTYNTLFDPPEWALTDTADRPCVKARQPFFRITIANADAAASPHTDAALREAARAVRDCR